MSLTLQQESVVDWEEGTRLNNAGFGEINDQRRKIGLHNLESDPLMSLDAGQHAVFLAKHHRDLCTPQALLQPREKEIMWHGHTRLEVLLENEVRERFAMWASESHPFEQGILLDPEACRMGIGTKVLALRDGLYLILVCRIRPH